MHDAVLTINAGSSSIKFALFETGADGPAEVSRGQVEGIGTAPHLVAKGGAGQVLVHRRWPEGKAQSHEELLGAALDWVEAHLGQERLIGVGHRVVHGGP